MVLSKGWSSCSPGAGCFSLLIAGARKTPQSSICKSPPALSHVSLRDLWVMPTAFSPPKLWPLPGDSEWLPHAVICNHFTHYTRPELLFSKTSRRVLLLSPPRLTVRDSREHLLKTERSHLGTKCSSAHVVVSFMQSARPRLWTSETFNRDSITCLPENSTAFPVLSLLLSQLVWNVSE